jgi:mRNA export factor
MQRSDRPIPCAGYNADGSIYAYAVSYNWYKGYQHAQTSHHILLHATQEVEVKSRGRATRR